MNLKQLEYLKAEDWEAFEDLHPQAAHYLNRQAMYREWLSLRIEIHQAISVDRRAAIECRLQVLDPIFGTHKIFARVA